MPTAAHSEPAENLPAAGWLFYDAECPFCTDTTHKAARVIAPRGFGILPLQTPWVREKLGLCADDPLREMIVLTRDDRRFGGADAALFLASRIWWARPLTWMARLPGITPWLRRAYAWIAARRSCVGGACALPHPRTAGHPADWWPLFFLPACVLAFARAWEPWIFMWVLAASIFAGCKWLTWRRGPHVHLGRSLAYLFLWPGMDAENFLRAAPAARRPLSSEWFFAAVKLLGGAALLWGATRLIPLERPLLVGWVGMVGLIFLLHFGAFHLLSLFWRSRGVDARPLMRAPIRATSLAEFWGRRWNAAFNDLAKRFVFRAVANRAGATTAALAVFIVSGVLHDLVISVPARGGYGLPTAYFAIQAGGLWVERTQVARRMGLGRGMVGWLFTLVVTVAPLGLLFHPPFVHAVILPMLAAIGAR